MPKFAANLSLMFTDYPFLDRFKAASDTGFEAVEFLFPYEVSISELQRRLNETSLKVVLFNLHPGDWDRGMRGLAALKGQEKAFEDAAHQAIDVAQKLGCHQLHAMAGLVEQGADRTTYIRNLKKLCALAVGHDITVLVEPINTDDMPGYFLNYTEVAAEIIKEVGAPNIGLQFDIYHRHKMQGDAIAAIRKYADLTRHYQCAAPRDRGEPDRIDVDYRDVFAAIDQTDFQGWVGCEYRPRARTEEGLAWRTTLMAS